MKDYIRLRSQDETVLVRLKNDSVKSRGERSFALLNCNGSMVKKEGHIKNVPFFFLG